MHFLSGLVFVFALATLNCTAYADQLSAEVAYIEMDPGLNGQALLSIGDTREGQLVFANLIAGCESLNKTICQTPVATFPIIVRNVRAGVGIGITADREKTIYPLLNWSGKNLKSIYRTFAGVSALSLDLSMFISFANFRATDAVAMNTARIVLYQGPKLAAAKDHGTSVELISSRFLQIIPRDNRTPVGIEAVPDIDLLQK